MRAKFIYLTFAVMVVLGLILLTTNVVAQKAEIDRLRQRVTNIETVINQPTKDTIYNRRAKTNEQRT